MLNSRTDLNEYARYVHREEGLTERQNILRYLCEGVGIRGDFWYGGSGKTVINREGHYQFNNTVRRMVRDGEVKLVRKPHHSNPFAWNGHGNPTINLTYMVATPKAYRAWVNIKRQKKL